MVFFLFVNVTNEESLKLYSFHRFFFCFLLRLGYPIVCILNAIISDHYIDLNVENLTKATASEWRELSKKNTKKNTSKEAAQKQFAREMKFILCFGYIVALGFCVAVNLIPKMNERTFRKIYILLWNDDDFRYYQSYLTHFLHFARYLHRSRSFWVWDHVLVFFFAFFTREKLFVSTNAQKYPEIISKYKVLSYNQWTLRRLENNNKNPLSIPKYSFYTLHSSISRWHLFC